MIDYVIHRKNRVAMHLGFFALLLVVWQWLAGVLPPFVLAPPTGIVAAYVDLIQRGKLAEALAESLRILIVGFVLASAAGLILGLLIGRYRVVQRSLEPLLNALYATPLIALVPVVMIWFGMGFKGKIVFVCIFTIFPVLINTYTGVREAPLDLLEMGRSFGATELEMFRHIILPSALPYIMTGLRLSVGRAIVGMAVAEVFLRLGGVGALIMAYGRSFATEHLYATIIVIPLMSILLSKVVGYFEVRLAPWKSGGFEERGW
ncbi:MAG: ABC transporter permease [Anaerolineae bacterium]